MIEGTSLLVRKCADGIMVGIRYDIVVKVLEIKDRMIPARVAHCYPLLPAANLLSILVMCIQIEFYI